MLRTSPRRRSGGRQTASPCRRPAHRHRPNAAGRQHLWQRDADGYRARRRVPVRGAGKDGRLDCSGEITYAEAAGPHGMWPAAILGAASRRTTAYRPAALLRQSDAPGRRSNVSASSTSRPGRQTGTKSGGGPAVARAAARSRAKPKHSTRRVRHPVVRKAALGDRILDCLLDIGQLRICVIGPQTQQIAACSQRSDSRPCHSDSAGGTGHIQGVADDEPEKPSSLRSRSSRTIRLIVAGCSRSSCGSRMCDVMITRQPASMAATNGSNSRWRS